MTLNYSTPVINPRLGSSFAIFASAYTCLVAMLMVLEQLGLSVPTIDELIIVTPALFYIAIGFMTRTTSTDDFLLAGRRVPPFYNALAFTSMVFGGSIMLGSIGSLFFLGIDAIAIPVGCFAGLVLTGVLFVPHLRKAGANTLPGFLHLRFGHRGVRLAAAALMLVPVPYYCRRGSRARRKTRRLFPAAAPSARYQPFASGILPDPRPRQRRSHGGSWRDAFRNVDSVCPIRRCSRHSRAPYRGLGYSDETAPPAADLWKPA